MSPFLLRSVHGTGRDGVPRPVPHDPTPGMLFWHDPKQLVLADGAELPNYTDFSGNAHHFARGGGGANGPARFRANGAAAGVPGTEFAHDPAQAGSAGNPRHSSTGGWLTGPAALEQIIVLRRINFDAPTEGNNNGLWEAGANDYWSQFPRSGNVAEIRDRWASSGPEEAFAPGVSVFDNFVYGIHSAANDYGIWINGVEVYHRALNVVGGFSFGNMVIGQSTIFVPANIMVVEHLIWPFKLSPAQRAYEVARMAVA